MQGEPGRTGLEGPFGPKVSDAGKKLSRGLK